MNPHLLLGLFRLRHVIRREVGLIRKVARHPQMPRLTRWCVIAAVVYVVLPMDLLPDVVPLLGQLDDAMIVSALIAFGLWLIPPHVIAECRMEGC